jgi:hypothetical protein
MTNIFLQENAIILAAYTRFVVLGQAAAVKVMGGKTPKKEDAQAAKLATYLKVYQSKASLSTKRLEAVLYALLELSDANSFPSVNPLVGPPIIYVIVTSGGGGTVVAVIPDGVMVYCDGVSLASNLYPTTGGTGTAGAIKKGNIFRVTAASTTLLGADGGIIPIGAMIMATQDLPGQTYWIQIPSVA